MKVLFLDFDGPLWPDRTIVHHPGNRNKEKLNWAKEVMIQNGDSFGAEIISYWKMDDVAVGMLNTIMEIEPFYTVVSSSWREFCSKETVDYLFFMNNLKLQLHPRAWLTDIPREGYSPNSREYVDRSTLIRRWLDTHRDNITDYVVLDDKDSGGLLPRADKMQLLGLDPKKIVIVDYQMGISPDDYHQLCSVLITDYVHV